MLLVIMFGIIALIVIVFLLNFNIRSISRHENQELQIEKQSDLSVNGADVPQSELLENQQFRKSTKENATKIPQASDVQYRQALRQFHSSQSKKPIATSTNKLNDTAYRAAIRSIKNQTDKDKQ